MQTFIGPKPHRLVNLARIDKRIFRGGVRDTVLAQFTTDAVRRGQRVEFWRQFVCDHVADVDCWLDEPVDFSGRINTYSFGRMSLSTLAADPHRVGRAKDRINRARNDYFLVIFQMSGSARYAQNGSESTLTKGDFVLYEPRMPYEMTLCEPFEHITLRLPRNALRGLSHDLCKVIGKPVRARTLGGELVGGLLASIVHRIGNLPLDTTFVYAESVVDMIVHAIANELTSESGRPRSVKGYTLAQAKQYILNNLHRDDLSLAMISDNIGVSQRHINRIFHTEGVSTGQWIKNMRLERCAAALVDSESISTPIGQIAFSAGFGDISHFCRDFKRRYKLTPSQYRKKFNAGAGH